MDDDPQIVARPIRSSTFSPGKSEGIEESRPQGGMASPSPMSRDEGEAKLPALARTANVVARRVREALTQRALSLRVAGVEEAGVELASAPRRLRMPSAYLLSFIAFVLIPSFGCALYLAFLASDQYVAEARFALQSAQFGLMGGGDTKSNDAAGAVSAVGAGSIPSLASQDAYIVTNYIHSRAILQDLAGKVDVAKIYQRPEADFWARLKRRPSAEELMDYWNGMVSTYIDGPSGIVTLRVKAFRPEDAQDLAQAILKASEKLANDVSERARQTVLGEAEAEVRRSEGLVEQALAAEQEFRNRQGYIDPVSAATSTSTLLLQAMSERIKLENDYFVESRAMSADAPTVVQAKSRLDALDEQIARLRAQLTGKSGKGRTISASLVTFESLELKRIFSEKLYTIAQDALEASRIRAQAQNIYISTFVPPDRPQEPEFPRRLALSLLIPIGLSVVWGIFALIASAVEDHRY